MNSRTNILQTPLVQRSVGKTGHRATDGDKVDRLRTRTLSSKKDDAYAAATIFEAFKEVALDLTLSFSPQNSPAASTSEVFAPSLPPTPPPLQPARTPSPGASAAPTGTLSRTLSFTTHLKKAKEKSRFSDFLPLQPSSSYRQTVGYTGRGTPVDKNKTRQWGGLFSSSSSSGQRVDEDGLLFTSDLRATSLDSHLPRPRLSSSSDWDFLNTGPFASESPCSTKRSVLAQSLLEDEEKEEDEAPPKIEFKLENGIVDWTSVLEIALPPAERDVLNGEASPPTIPEEVEERRVAVVKEVQSTTATITNDDPRPAVVVGLEKKQSSPEVRFDVHIDKAFDLGSTPAGDGGTLFNLVDSNPSNPTINGRNPTESSLSQYSTPSEGASDDGPAQALTTTVVSPGSNGQVKYEGNPVVRAETNLRDSVSLSPKAEGGVPWWKKGLEKLKRLQVRLRAPRSLC